MIVLTAILLFAFRTPKTILDKLSRIF